MSDLLTAAKNGYYTEVLALLSTNSYDVDARDKDKATPLYWSASRGHAKICQALLQAGCDVNACVKWGSTALHAASDRGHADCLIVLLDRGADVQVQNERGDTALHLAAYRGFKDLVQLLVATGRADPFLKNAQSKTPLQEAQSQQHTAAAALLQKYMESLGCHPFKSLPMSETSSGQSPPEQPTSSAPAQSWPPYQSFPKYPDTTPPTELSRPYTYPLRVNTLAQDAQGAGGSCMLQAPSRAGGGSEVRFNELSGNTGLKGLPGSPASRKDRFHVHSDPQENADECMELSNADAMRLEHHDRVRGDDRRHPSPHRSNGVVLNQLSYPAGGGYHTDGTAMSPSPGHSRHSAQSSPGSVCRRQNGKDTWNGASKASSYETDLSPPQIVPPKHPPQGFVNHEDLTLFAESLQLEVVKLRDKLSSKERQVSDLENLLRSLKTQKSQLQQLAAEKLKESDQALASKDSELSDLKRRLIDLERQNLCLQQAVAEGQASWTQMSTQRDSMISELTGKVSDLKRLNQSLQQLLVTQQDTMKGILASKDTQIAALRDKVADLAHKMASSVIAASGNSVPPGDVPPARVQSATPKGNHHPLVDGELVTRTVATLETSNVPARSVISVCDQPANLPSLQTNTSQTHAECPLKLEASLTTPNRGTSSTSSMTFFARSVSALKPGSATDGVQQCHLRAVVSRLFQSPSDSGKLDVDGREWTVGKEFQLLESRPVNCGSDGQRRGSCSLVFSIQHQGRKYMLKMLTNLINLSYEAHSQGRSLDAHLLHCFGAEFHAPLLLHQHPNIVRVRHHYQGDTSHFARYLSLLMPPTLDVPVEMARRTTFLVLEHYPQTLQTFMDDLRRDGKEEQRRIRKDKLWEQFLLQLVYQLLSAVEYLQRHDVVHRDIKADNVFLDWRLRPVLGDFGLARTLRGYGGQSVAVFTDRSQVMAGNSYAWAPELCRWSRTEPSALPQPMTLKDIYSKTDGFAVARMFYHLFNHHDHNDGEVEDEHEDKDKSGGGSSDRFPTSTVQKPHYPDSAVGLLPSPVCPGLAHVLHALVLDDPARRPSVRQALCMVGVLLCQPTVALTSEEETEEFCASQLLALSPALSSPGGCRQPEGEKTLSVTQSVAANQNRCLADFLLNFSGAEFWETYTEMTSLGF